MDKNNFFTRIDFLNLCIWGLNMEFGTEVFPVEDVVKPCCLAVFASF